MKYFLSRTPGLFNLSGMVFNLQRLLPVNRGVMGNAREEKIHAQTAANRLRLELPRLRREYAVASLSLFGSYVRGEQRKGSDLDVLVEFSKVPGMLRFLDLERDLSHLLGVSVDLVQKEALKPSIGKRILEEVLPI
jgi:uncharacterized protein